MVEDYTQMPAGVTLQKGDTAECPHCKKVGVVERRDNNVFYFHRLGYKLVANQSIVGIIDETCPTSVGVKRK
jgi:predicted  nucleic acid-binding Zn ribbon protein